jgi:hypothetical protein
MNLPKQNAEDSDKDSLCLLSSFGTMRSFAKLISLSATLGGDAGGDLAGEEM